MLKVQDGGWWHRFTSTKAHLTVGGIMIGKHLRAKSSYGKMGIQQQGGVSNDRASTLKGPTTSLTPPHWEPSLQHINPLGQTPSTPLQGSSDFIFLHDSVLASSMFLATYLLLGYIQWVNIYYSQPLLSAVNSVASFGMSLPSFLILSHLLFGS